MNKILQGDCLELMKDIPDKSVDMILCDLPYGTTACKWDTIIPFDKLWGNYERIIKDDGVIVLTASQPFTSALVMSNSKLFKYELIWHKNTPSNFASAKYRPIKYHESILIFSRGKSTYNPQKIQRSSKSSLDRYKYFIKNGGGGKHNPSMKVIKNKYDFDLKNPESVLFFKSVPNHKGKLHPTQKPLELFEYLIKTYTNEGDLVLDNCVGSGTTNIACLNTNRRCIGMEKDEEYFKIATERLNKEKQQVRL